MRIRANVKLKEVEMKSLMQCHKPVEVQGYCANCSNYEKNYTCPGFDFDELKYLEPYKYATLIMTHIETDEIRSNQAEYEKKNYPSRVFTNYVKNNPNVPTDWKSMISMYVFDHVKGQVEEALLNIEKQSPDIVGLPPGSCTRCEVCTRELGRPCVFPEQIRYSLEALGFLVSDIYKDHFNLELAWAGQELSASFNTCSAILSKNPLKQDKILKNLGKIGVDL